MHPLVITHGRAVVRDICYAAGVLAVPGAYAWGAMAPGSQWFGRTLIAGGDASEIALTFDDGPNGDTTVRLLDVLAEHRAKATFFVIGEYARKQPEIVRRIADAGHAVGNHTMTHPRLLLVSAARLRQELRDCSAAISDILGREARLFRPPFGGRRMGTLGVVREAGLVPVMWNAMGMDWQLTEGAAVAARVVAGIQRNQRNGCGSNVLLHDGSHRGMGWNRDASVDAAERVMRMYAKAKFVTLDAWAKERFSS
jgi:peptidoglycan-N-acetylglucosamine deacetylase